MTKKTEEERQALIEDYHSNGIALMVTAFGSTGRYACSASTKGRLPHDTGCRPH